MIIIKMCHLPAGVRIEPSLHYLVSARLNLCDVNSEVDMYF